MAAESELTKLGLHFVMLEFGEIEIEEQIFESQHDILKTALFRHGLELMDENKAVLISKIKKVIIEMVRSSNELPAVKYSCYLSQKLNFSYTYLSNLFSDAKGITIEQFIISHKIERVKEFLRYSDLTLTEISLMLNYSSVAHLSGQFKKITGLTPSFYRKMKQSGIRAA